jgi:hypothetical protein
MTTMFEAALARLRGRGAALGGSMLLTLPTGACTVDATDESVLESPDWAQFEGKRDTRMVAFTGHWYSECANGNTRFGCGDVNIHIFVRVKPVAGVDLAWKKVGLVFKSPDDLTERTVVGGYRYTYPNGNEEWRVTVRVPQHQSVIAFDAWYQDGAGNTYLDDNAVAVTQGSTGIAGTISAQVADLDFDKQLELVATTDGWQTVHRFGIGVQGEKNKWYWVEDFAHAAGRERWQIDIDLPGGAELFEYAAGYRHGVVNNAKPYEFWDNNGGANYRVLP